MIKFYGKSNDPSYDKEMLFLKEVSGYGFKNSGDDAYILIEADDWCSIDPETLRIDTNTKEAFDEDDDEE